MHLIQKEITTQDRTGLEKDCPMRISILYVLLCFSYMLVCVNEKKKEEEDIENLNRHRSILEKEKRIFNFLSTIVRQLDF